MKRKALAGMVVALTLFAMTGCADTTTDSNPTDQDLQSTETVVVSEVPEGTGKMSVNFEGRVTAVEDNQVTLDNGKTVLISDTTSVVAYDSSATTIAVGDYIQGYATDPDSDALEALNILVTVL